MRSEFDPLRTSALPDSFEQTADWLRNTPPPAKRRPPAAAFVLVLLLIGACSWPVRTVLEAGSVIEVFTLDEIDDTHPTLRALDRLVPDSHRHLIEVEEVETDSARGSVLRYAVLGADSTTVGRWRDSVASLPGTQAARVLKLDVMERRPLGIVTARRVLGVTTTPRLSDEELQAVLDRAFRDATPISIRVRRSASGERVLSLNDHVTVNVRPDTRISSIQSQDSTMSGIVIEGTGQGGARIGDRVVGRQRLDASMTSSEFSLDSLPPDVARIIRDQLDEQLRFADSLRISVAPEARLDTIRRFMMMRSDSMPTPLPPGVRVDTVRRVILFKTHRDSL